MLNAGHGSGSSAADSASAMNRRSPSWHSWRSRSSGQAAPGGSAADAAGHYAAHEATDVLVADIREFFALLAGGTTPRSPLRAEADAD